MALEPNEPVGVSGSFVGVGPRPPGMTGQTETAAVIKGRGFGDRGKIKVAFAYTNVVTYQLYRDFGYTSAEEWVEKELQGEPSLKSMQDWAAIASRFTEDQAVTFTCHKLSHLLTYAKLKGIADLSQPGEIPIEISKEPPIVRPFKACSVADVERALEREREPRSRPAHLVAYDEKARDLQQWLKSESVLGPGSFVEVEVQRRGRSAVLRIENLSIEEADRLKALKSKP